MKGRDVEENFRQLFQSHYPAVSRFFARSGFSADDCRDLTQEVFLAVYMGLDTLRSDTAFVAWLFSIARHIGFRHLERQEKFRIRTATYDSPQYADGETRTPDSIMAAQPDPLRRLLDLEKIRVIRKALSELPSRVQDCLRASLVDGMKYGEIGERLGISENTVAVHVHRGLKSLRRRVKVVFKEAPFVGEL
jgi:RNA polymerase sigma-70 factor (ECF subfamily)